MLLTDKVAVVHGGAGAVGSAVAREFAAQGAQVFLTGRRKDPLLRLAKELTAAGSRVAVDVLDAQDETGVQAHADSVVDRAGRIDAVFNAVRVDAVQGTPLSELPMEDFLAPVHGWLRTQLLTARAAAQHMTGRRAGVVLMLSASSAPRAIAGTGGFGVAGAAVEALTRTLAAELGPSNVRVVCLRPHRIGEALGDTADLPMDPMDFRRFLENMTLLGRLPTLADVARTAAFLVSDGAASVTGSVVDLSCGMNV